MKLKLIKRVVLEFVLWFVFFSGFVNIAKMVMSYMNHNFTTSVIFELLINIRLEILTLTIAAGFLLVVTKWD